MKVLGYGESTNSFPTGFARSKEDGIFQVRFQNVLFHIWEAASPQLSISETPSLRGVIQWTDNDTYLMYGDILFAGGQVSSIEFHL
jgi:hypothetical protein